MRYPKECPVFEVVETCVPMLCPVGEHLEGAIDEDEYTPEFLGLYSINDSGFIAWADDFTGQEPLVRVRPLTPSAEDMLAIAKAGK